MEQFAVVKSGTGAKIVGPFFTFDAACQHIMLNKLIGFTVLPMENPEKVAVAANSIEQCALKFLALRPELVDRKIELIKLVRSDTGCSLIEAKNAVDVVLPKFILANNRATTNPWQN